MMTASVAARRARLLSGSAVALMAALVGPRAALAADECGAAAPGGTVTCTPAGNSFPNGIQYKVDDLTIVVQDGVVIDTTSKAGEPGGVVSGDAGNYGNLTVKAGTAAGSGVTITTDEDLAAGIEVATEDGAALITSHAAIVTTGEDSDGIVGYSKTGVVSIYHKGSIATTGEGGRGIFGRSEGAHVQISGSGEISTEGDFARGVYAAGNTAAEIQWKGAITTAGQVSDALFAYNKNGEVDIVSTGDLTTTGNTSNGILAASYDSSVEVKSTGDITTSGTKSNGIYASGGADVSVVSSGDIRTANSDSRGIYAKSTDDDVAITSTGDITTLKSGSSGIQALTGAGGDIIITSTGDIDATGTKSDAVNAKTADGDINITSTGDLDANSFYGHGIRALSDTGKITITHIGDIETYGTGGFGIRAITKNDITITVDGDMTIRDAAAILAQASAGNVIIDTTGDISTKNDNSPGLQATAKDGVVDITHVGTITTLGEGSQAIDAEGFKGVEISFTGEISTADKGSTGIDALSKAGGISIKSNGDITVAGYGSRAILAVAETEILVKSVGDLTTGGTYGAGISASSNAGSVTVYSTGDIATKGNGGFGISAVTNLGNVIVVSRGDIDIGGAADGINAYSADGNIIVVASGAITTIQNNSSGIEVLAKDGEAIVALAGGANADIHTNGKDSDGVSLEASALAATSVRDVIADGRDSDAVYIKSGTNLARVEVHGDVHGGWGDAIGIRFDGGNSAALDIREGSVGAWSDIAIVEGGAALDFENRGTVIGMFDLGAGNDKLRNYGGGTIALRALVDNDGNQIRDTESVAIADFGAGTDSFDNKGILTLADAGDPGAWMTGDEVKHPGGGNSDITQDGIEQGFLLGLETFTLSGLITLSDGVAGDLLVITDQADGKTKGANVFTSDGGSLALDVVLDDGSSKQSDVLILDKAVTGTGATLVSIANAGGLGGQTSGDGILVINVRDKSDADAFASAGLAVAGAYQYDLVFQNAAKTDQNWYLQSSFFEGSLEYPAISGGALVTWYSDLAGLGDQLRKRRAQAAAQDAAIGQVAELPGTATDMADASTVRIGDGGGNAGWFRVSGADMDIEQSGAADFDLNTTRAEAGVDVGFNDLFGAEDWLVAGAFAGYGWSSVGFDSGSEIDFDIATLGAYATYFRGPYYLDALVKLDWLDGTFNSENVSQDGDLSLPVFGLSLESGYRFDLSPRGLYLQPQVQLSYAHAGGDSFTDDSGVKIKLEDADSLRGRLGARVGQELSTTAGAAAEPVRGNFYLEAAVNQEFLGETEAKVSGLTLQQELPETTFEVGGGFDIALPKEGVSFTVDADYTFGDEAEGVSATGGVRITW
jgi:outer membrane autotransporter protein